MSGTSFLFFWLVCFIALARPIAVSPQTPEASPIAIDTTAEIDRIHLGDIIDVDFAGGFDFDWRGPLTPEGNLDWPAADLPEPIFALCRSESDIASDIERIFSKTLRDPKVIVRIIDRSRRAVVRLEGAVKMPVRFRLLRTVHLRELLIAAGGFVDEASGDIEIYRQDNSNCLKQMSAVPGETEIDNPQRGRGNGFQMFNIKIKDLLAGKESADPNILSGDVITVKKAEPIYVIGAVNNPRPVFSHSGMTLTRAIDSAGGLAKGAVEQNISIYRRQGTESQIVRADLQKIKSGETGDIDLKAFDIIEIAFKGRAQRKYPPVVTVGGGKEQSADDLPLKVID